MRGSGRLDRARQLDLLHEERARLVALGILLCREQLLLELLHLGMHDARCTAHGAREGMPM